MKINFYIDEYDNEHIDFYVKQITPQLQEIANQLQNSGVTIWGIQNKKFTPINFTEIVRLYTNHSKVFIDTIDNTYNTRYRLYQVNPLLPHNFIQISNSEIVNFDFIDHLELTINSTIKLIFKNQQYSYVSRRYVSKIKKRLGI